MIMRFISANLRSLAFGITAALLLASSASAAEVRVMISGGLTTAYQALVPEFERATGNKVLTAYTGHRWGRRSMRSRSGSSAAKAPTS
jgi:molybdate transport system substrate-binding protein